MIEQQIPIVKTGLKLLLAKEVQNNTQNTNYLFTVTLAEADSLRRKKRVRALILHYSQSLLGLLNYSATSDLSHGLFK